MSSMKDRATDEEGMPGPDSRDDDGGRSLKAVPDPRRGGRPVHSGYER